MLVLSYLQPRIKWKHVCICLLAPLVGSKLPDSAFHTELHLLPSINSTKTGQPSTHSSEWDSLPRWCLVAVTIRTGQHNPHAPTRTYSRPSCFIPIKMSISCAPIYDQYQLWNSSFHPFLPTQSHVCSGIWKSSPVILYWIILSL